MAYQNLTLRNIAGEITAVYNDGTFRSLTPPDPRSGSTAAFVGTAETGVIHEFFEHVDRSLTFREFGADSEIAQMVQSAKVSDAALPVIVSRIGAKNFNFAITRPTAEGFYEKDHLVDVTPLFVQEENSDLNRKDTLSTLKMILLPYVDGSLAKQRLILGLTRNDGEVSVVYDSERKLISQGESIFNIELNLPIGELLLTNSALKAADQIKVADNANGFLYKDQPNTIQNSSSERLDLLRELNNIVEFDWTNAKFLAEWHVTDAPNGVQLTDVHVLYPYEATTPADVVQTLNELTDAKIEQINGKSNKDLSNVSKRYVGTDLAYRGLEYENVGFIYCEGCHADIESIDIDVDLAGKTTGEQLTWPQRNLGNLWKVVHNGQEYSYMFGRNDPFEIADQAPTYRVDLDNGGGAATCIFQFSEAQRAIGDLLNLVEVHFHELGNGVATTVESFANKKGMIECHISVAADSVNPSIKTDFFNLQIDENAAITLVNGLVTRLRPSLVNATEDLSNWLKSADAKDTAGNDWNSDDPFVMTHYDLTGQFVPEAVVKKLFKFEEGLPDQTAEHGATLVATKAQVREISFLHQSAQAAYQASTNYSQTLAIVPTSAPSNSNDGLASWAGNTPTYEVSSNGKLEVTVNGTNVLGNKLLAGNTSYRGGAAFGGIILTNGNDLPSKIPYGIDDDDEAVDAFGQVIDLGKHVVVVGAYGLVQDPASVLAQGNNARRNPIYVNAGPKICGMLNALPPGSEPIGTVNGRVSGMTPRHRTSMAILNDLAFMRICMIDQNSVISSIYSAANPTSDYRKISSTLAANAILGQLRRICMPYIGRPFKDEQIASLTQTIDGVMKQMVTADHAQRIDVSLSASRLDRINGVLKASVRFVPPLSIEAITVEITLEPPAAGN